MSQTQTTSQTSPARDTHVYKVADGREVEADVIGARLGASKPCVIWIHGGGLIFGSRKTSPRGPFLRALLERDFVIVSIDHRLAPETKLPAILEDVHDAWRWVHDVGPGRFGIDPARVAMAGGSAGAYLSLLAGYLFEPRPRALASFWGYGDITAPWEVDPSAHYRQMDLVTREDADNSLSAPPLQDPAVGVDRSCFYLYCRQQGKWLEEVTAHDPHEDNAWFDRYCPIRNVAPEFPPTVLVHGEVDTDVPHAESARLAARFAEVGVNHRFISLAGVGHGFAGARPEDAETAEIVVAEFLRVQLQLAH
jgi:acetyl esterase/lipase